MSKMSFCLPQLHHHPLSPSVPPTPPKSARRATLSSSTANVPVLGVIPNRDPSLRKEPLELSRTLPRPGTAPLS